MNNFFHRFFNSYITVDIPEFEKQMLCGITQCAKQPYVHLSNTVGQPLDFVVRFPNFILKD